MKKWKPEHDEIYYIPDLANKYLYKNYYWIDGCVESQRRYDLGIVCKTEYQAKRLAKEMIKRVKEIKNDK